MQTQIKNKVPLKLLRIAPLALVLFYVIGIKNSSFFDTAEKNILLGLVAFLSLFAFGLLLKENRNYEIISRQKLGILIFFLLLGSVLMFFMY